MVLKPPIGIDNFEKVIEKGYLYVDKTLMIEEILESAAEVQLITRPRRFGKSINLSMLRYFFDNRVENGARLFQGLAIEKRPCFELQGRFPVISLSLKDLKGSDFAMFLKLFDNMMGNVFDKCRYLMEDLTPREQVKFDEIGMGKAEPGDLVSSLALLMKLLHRHHGQRVVLLIDEYDSPIHEAYAKGYYGQMIDFMRPFLGMALKSNNSLEKAVLTGILRVARESIFSDLNNVKVFTLLEPQFADKFGFTLTEMDMLLEQAELMDRKPDIERWYNGYMAAQTVIYNPWSILCYLDGPVDVFKPHWVNTSSNDLIREQLLGATPEIQDQLMGLLQGETVETRIQDRTVFRDLALDAETLWSFLFFCGYLKVVSHTIREERFTYQLAIPNTEVKLLFQDIIAGWLRRHYGGDKVAKLLESLITGDFEVTGILLGDLVRSVLSYYDTDARKPERVYHAFVLGLLVHLHSRYEIKSNRESGLGRYDLMLRPRNSSDRGISLEFKTAETSDGLEAALEAGLAQIQKHDYGNELEAAGIAIRSEITVAFCGKDVRIKGREISL